ncbi:hypothetical protein F8N00_12185 [Exiguobacterium sp. A1_3_1]|uniref:putative quinol monooxygenase n=1 Tax=Exiguobacterium sp. A1_3_1 TaxID=2651871 RepID=UPI003B8A38B6
MDQFGVLTHYKCTVNDHESLFQVLNELKQLVLEQSECKLYTINVSDKQLDAIFTYEIWSSAAAYQNSLSHELQKFVPLAPSLPVVVVEETNTFRVHM